MSFTKQAYKIKSDDGWKLTLAVKGFIVIKEPYDFEFAYTAIDDVESSGSITTVTDAKIPLFGITSVTESNGIARFNHQLSIIDVGREVQISGYTTNINYNGVFIVTDSELNYFEIDTILFGSDEASGEFKGDAIIVESVAHGLSEGDVLRITNTTNYDGEYSIWDVQTDTFRVNAVFVADDTGTWIIPAPISLTQGNRNKERVIHNNETSVLWVRTIKYDITVTENVE